jgi:hypothetical protein
MFIIKVGHINANLFEERFNVFIFFIMWIYFWLTSPEYRMLVSIISLTNDTVVFFSVYKHWEVLMFLQIYHKEEYIM